MMSVVTVVTTPVMRRPAVVSMLLTSHQRADQTAEATGRVVASAVVRGTMVRRAVVVTSVGWRGRSAVVVVMTSVVMGRRGRRRRRVVVSVMPVVSVTVAVGVMTSTQPMLQLVRDHRAAQSTRHGAELAPEELLSRVPSCRAAADGGDEAAFAFLACAELCVVAWWTGGSGAVVGGGAGKAERGEGGVRAF